MEREHIPNEPSADDLIFVIKPGGFAHGFDDVEHAHTFTFTQVVRLASSVIRAVVEHLRVGCECLEREEMPLRQVHHVEIISDTCSVRSWVVVAKDAQFVVFDTADGHVGEKREEVTGPPAGVFAN